MAEEINFIRPQEVYDRNTGESKVRYRSYDGNDRFIPVVDGEKGVPKTMVEVTHAELKAMRDGGKLTAGALYRITDYNCTTTQENTRSAGHQFDIVLLALSENKLAEEGWAMMHNNIYDVVFNDGTIEKCYVYEYEQGQYNIVRTDNLLGLDVADEGRFDGEQFNAGDSGYNDLISEGLTYNYFQNSNLSAWKVWYCLDNDTARFAWADDNLPSIVDEDTIYVRKPSSDIGDLFAWYNENDNIYDYTKTEHPSIGDETFDEEGGTNANVSNVFGFGRGVIYRLIDEFNNDIKYDFKNIQFKRKLTNGQYDKNGTETWCYTLNIWYNDMCQDASIVGNTLLNDEGFVSGVYDNKFGYATARNLHIEYIEGVNTFAFALGDNVVLSVLEDYYDGIYSNTIGNAFYKNTIGSGFYENTIGNIFDSNTIANNFQSNTIKDAFLRNVIEDDFLGNMIGINFMDNTIGNGFKSNMVGNYFSRKTIGDNIAQKNYGNNGVELATKS